MLVFIKRILIFLPSFAIVIVACTTESGIRPTTSLPTENDFEKTSTPTQTPSPVKTNSATPEATASSFLTPTLPLETLNALATMDALVTQKPELGKYYSWNCMLSPCYVSGLGLSPDGKWAVFFNTKESGGLSIASIDGKKQWGIYFSEITGWTCPCGDARVQIVRWTRDGNYLYVTPIDGSSGGFEWLWRSKEQLVRINLDKGTWVDTKMGPAFSFSPSERFIAHRLGRDVVVHEFQSGSERFFTLPSEYKAFGAFVWSADEKRIIFVASINNLEQEDAPDGFTLYLLDLDSMSLKTLLEKDNRYLYPIEWITTDQVLLESLFEVQNNKLKFSGQQYYLNFETNEISVKEQ